MIGAKHSPFFFVDEPLVPNGSTVVRGTDARHLRVVRRAKVGDKITLSDGKGLVAEAEISRLEASKVETRVGETHLAGKRNPGITVFQGLAKGIRPEFAIQKLVELGVDAIHVFFAGRSIPRWDTVRSQHAVERWMAVAREAAKQSRRPWLPEVIGPHDLKHVVESLKDGHPAFLLHEDASRRLKELLPPEIPAYISMVVGPEGGFTEREVGALEAAGALPVTLGPQILRTETAALAAAAGILFHYGILG